MEPMQDEHPAARARSLRERIFGSTDSSSETIVVEEWDGVKLEVRSMTGNERAGLLEELQRQSGGSVEGGVDYRHIYPALLVATVYDPDTGERVFQIGDVEQIMERNSGVLERVAKVALRLSGMDKEAEARLGKGSSSIPRDGSTST